MRAQLRVHRLPRDAEDARCLALVTLREFENACEEEPVHLAVRGGVEIRGRRQRSANERVDVESAEARQSGQMAFGPMPPHVPPVLIGQTGVT